MYYEGETYDPVLRMNENYDYLRELPKSYTKAYCLKKRGVTELSICHHLYDCECTCCKHIVYISSKIPCERFFRTFSQKSRSNICTFHFVFNPLAEMAKNIELHLNGVSTVHGNDDTCQTSEFHKVRGWLMCPYR